MIQFIKDETPNTCELSGKVKYTDLFVEGGRYVFDGNRLTAHFKIGTNGVGWWRLKTVDPNLDFVVAHDLRVRKYTGTSHDVRIVGQFESVFDALKPLNEAIHYCAKHGHAWSPTQPKLGRADTSYSWQWCLTCGAEQVWFPDDGEWVMWPEDGAEIAVRTAGTLPRLHGPVFKTGGHLL